MGQQQEIVAGSALRRLVLVLAVVAVMAMLLVFMASPAFAKAAVSKVRGDETNATGVITPSEKVNISAHIHPSKDLQGGGSGGGGAEQVPNILEGVEGTVVNSPSGNSNGTFHG